MAPGHPAERGASISAAFGYDRSRRVLTGWYSPGIAGWKATALDPASALRAGVATLRRLAQVMDWAVWAALMPPAALVGWLYVSEANPVVGGGNTGEFQVMAGVLGIAHPPGYPLYTMLAHTAARLPLPGDAAGRVNALTALLGAIAVLVAGTLCVALQRSDGRGRADADHSRRSVVLGSAVTVLAVGAMPRLWSLAVEAEVFTLHLALVLAFWLGLLAWDTRAERGEAHADRALLMGALLMGLGLANHRTFLFVALAGVAFVVVRRPRVLRRGRLVLACAGCVALGLSPYLYVLRGLVLPLAYLSPDDVRRLSPRDVWYVLQGNASGETESGRIVLRLLADPDALVGCARWLWRHVAEQFGAWGSGAAALGSVGLLVRVARRPAWTVSCLCGAAGAALFAMAYSLQPQGTDADRYLLPLEALCAIGVGTMVCEARRWLEGPARGWAMWITRAAGGAVGLAAAGYCAASLTGLAEATSFTPGPYRDYVVPNLRAMERGAVLCMPWPTTWGWRYAQHLDGMRRDVRVVARGTRDCLDHDVPAEFGRRAVYVPILTGRARRSPFVFFPEGDLWKVVTRREALRDGALLKSRGDRIYLLAGGRRRWVASLQVFTARGFRWDDVRLAPDYILDEFEEDAPLVD